MQRLFALCLLLGLTVSLAAVSAVAPPAEVAITRVKEGLRFTVGTETVGTLYTGKEWAKPYFWPLNAPGGIPVTRSWPMVKGEKGDTTDHVHQKSLWFTYGDVIPEGIDIKRREKGPEGVDFWTEEEGHGVIACVGIDDPVNEKDYARVVTRNEWRTPDGRKILDEVRTIQLRDLGKARLLVFEIELQANDAPIVFGDTKEGAFGLRIADGLREKGGNGALENADGKKKMAECWGAKSAWCDYSGSVDGKPVGVTIFDDPENPSPACWHSRDYGLMAANPFGRDHSGFPAVKGRTDRLRLALKEKFKFRYGVYVHTGNTAEGGIADAYQQFLALRKPAPKP